MQRCWSSLLYVSSGLFFVASDLRRHPPPAHPYPVTLLGWCAFLARVNCQGQPLTPFGLWLTRVTWTLISVRTHGAETKSQDPHPRTPDKEIFISILIYIDLSGLPAGLRVNLGLRVLCSY